MKNDKKKTHPWQRMVCDNQQIRQKAHRESVIGMVLRKEISIDEGARRLKEYNE